MKLPELLASLAPRGSWVDSCRPNPSIRRGGDYKTQSINWRAPIKTPPGLNPPYRATHQPGRTKAALSHCLLVLLYMSQDALWLCAHIFFRVSLSLSIFLSRFLHLSLTLFPTADLLFSCGIWDPIQRAHYSVLILSRGWAPSGRMGDYAPPPTNPLFSLCHAMMSWLLFAPVLHTPYLLLPAPYPH